jgi:hypothetical protein
MKYLLIGVALSIMSAFVGCLFPFVSLGSYAKEPINIVWGFIYGFGWYAAGLLSDPRNPWAQLFGGKIWPLLIMGSLVYYRVVQAIIRAIVARSAETLGDQAHALAHALRIMYIMLNNDRVTNPRI